MFFTGLSKRAFFSRDESRRALTRHWHTHFWPQFVYALIAVDPLGSIELAAGPSDAQLSRRVSFRAVLKPHIAQTLASQRFGERAMRAFRSSLSSIWMRPLLF